MGFGSHIDLYMTDHEIVLRHTPYALSMPFERIRNFKISSVAGVDIAEKTVTNGVGVLTLVIPGSAEPDSQDPQLKSNKVTISFDVNSDLNRVCP
jgi:hypothetical protein